MITETGQIVQLNVEEEHKREPRLVQIQLQLMVVQIVLEMRLKLRTVTNTSAEVIQRFFKGILTRVRVAPDFFEVLCVFERSK